MAQHHDRRDAWSVNPSSDSRTPSVDLPSGRSGGPSAISRLGRAVKTLVTLAILAGLAWAAWTYGRPLYGKFKLNSDVESAAVGFAHQLPEKTSNETELLTAATYAANDKLRSYLAKKARWHVAFGRSVEELTVIRDDSFTPLEKAFASKAFEEAKRKAEPSTSDYETLEFPLGAVVERVDVANEPWYVAAVWCE
jgi:hypothetical protein